MLDGRLQIVESRRHSDEVVVFTGVDIVGSDVYVIDVSRCSYTSDGLAAEAEFLATNSDTKIDARSTQ